VSVALILADVYSMYVMNSTSPNFDTVN